MPVLDTGIQAVWLVTSNPVWRPSVLHTLGRCRSDAVDGRIKSGHDEPNAIALQPR